MLPEYQALQANPGPPVHQRAEVLDNPVSVGAVGGSGTRLVASMLSEGGVAMGAPINRAGDAIEWPPLITLLEGLEAEARDHMLRSALGVFETLLLRRREELGLQGRAGWKVPGNFVWLRELNGFFPGLQYVHLMRNGLDMAYSGNQSQVANWAHRFELEIAHTDDGRVEPSVMLEYWLRANRFALDTGQEVLGERFLLLRFEELCAEPLVQVQRLFDFLDIPLAANALDRIAGLVRPPSSIGRFRERNWQEDFSDSQLQRLAELGYSIDA